MNDFQSMMLIAVPQLGDPHFAHTVIFLIHHDSQGAIGLILNRSLPLKMKEFANGQKILCHKNLQEVPVYSGGPVEKEVGWILHQDDRQQERHQIRPDIFVSRGRQTLIQLLSEGVQPFRLLLGYAGWGAGQLEKEMKEGSWIASEVNARYIFETAPQELWKKILEDMGVDPARLALGAGLH